MKVLSIPPAGIRDPKATEMARVWAAEKGLHCCLNIGVYRNSGHRESTAWGVILSDLARHVANALSEAGDEPSSEVALAEIFRIIQREIEEPTAEATGSFSDTMQ